MYKKDKNDDRHEKFINYLSNFKNLPYGVAIAKNDRFATIIQANEAFYKIIGYTEEQFLQKHENRMTDILIDNLYDSLKTRTTDEDYDVEWDLRLYTANGEVRWIHDILHYNAELDLFFVTIIDVTDKMLIEKNELSYEAFQTNQGILSYLNAYTMEHIVVTDDVTDEVVYLNQSAMEVLGFTSESDWKGKPYCELGFGSKDDVDPSYHQPVTENKFTVREYYNKFHKMHVHAKTRLITIPALNKKMRLNIINDVTAQKQLEYKMKVQQTIHECIDVLFSVGATSQNPKVGYTAILNQLKDYYDADGAYLYKFSTETHEVERVHTVLNDNLKEINHVLPMNMNDENLKLIEILSNAKTSNIGNELNSFSEEYKETLKKQQKDYQIKNFACVSVKNVAGEVLAFIGVINPKRYKDNKELMELLSRSICMFIEYQEEQKLKQELVKLEASSKANVVKQCVENFREFTHCKAHVTAVLDALCSHYDADCAVTLTSDTDKDGDYGISHIGGKRPQSFDFLERQPASAMRKWEKTFEGHNHFVTDNDLDIPEAKKLLKEKFGIYNFIASPIHDEKGELTGLLYVMNYKTLNRSNLLVHIVANNISDYLDKIQLYAEKHLEPLTKLTDKVATQNQISEYLEDGEKGTMFLIDIDKFKNLNDKLGHQIGDKAIVAFADIIKKSFKNTDVVGRIGGDEFMVYCPDMNEEDLIHKKAQELNQSCSLTFTNGDVSADITASIGICLVGEKYTTFPLLYENTDNALYVSKREGRNQYTIYK